MSDLPCSFPRDEERGFVPPLPPNYTPRQVGYGSLDTVIKPQPEHTAEELALVQRVPVGAAAFDAAGKCAIGQHCVVAVTRLDPADTRPAPRGVLAPPTRQPGTARGTHTARVLAWLRERGVPATRQQAADALGMRCAMAMTGLQLTKPAVLKTRCYRIPKPGHPRPRPVHEWLPVEVDWPPLPAGAVAVEDQP